MNIRKIRNRLLIFNIVSDSLCILMIPFIPIGFIYKDKWYMLFLAIVGIVCACFLVYGTVFFWLRFNTLNRRSIIYDCVFNNNLYNVNDIYNYTLIRKEYIDSDIRYLIRVKAINGYNFDGLKLIKKDNIKIDKYQVMFSCVNCGSKEMKKISDDTYKCLYCLSEFKI